MPKKIGSPLLQKLSNLLKNSIFVAKMRRTIITQLVYLKKTRKVKKLMFRKHYNYRYIREYEFSPSNNTPLMQYYGKPLKKRRYKDLYSMLFVCNCLGMLQSEEYEDRRFSMDLVALPCSSEDGLVKELSEGSDFSSGEDDDCVDEKAEKFIERFYEEMRKQRQEGALMLLN